ncbi:MAG: hypothetical protein Q3968_08415 [Clostridiaceae bacterium]|nr:hypothetical protein [Clostridiaceae bacterium]
MAFAELKCKNCGQSISIDAQSGVAVCEFCGSVYTDENSSVSTKVENASALLTKLNEPEKAKRLFEQISEECPGDCRGWLGIARVITADFSAEKLSLNQFREAQMNIDKAISVSDDETSESIKSQWLKYCSEINDDIKSKEDTLNELLKKQSVFLDKRQQLNDKLSEEEKASGKINKTYSTAVVIFCAALVVFAVLLILAICIFFSDFVLGDKSRLPLILVIIGLVLTVVGILPVLSKRKAVKEVQSALNNLMLELNDISGQIEKTADLIEQAKETV